MAGSEQQRISMPPSLQVLERKRIRLIVDAILGIGRAEQQQPCQSMLPNKCSDSILIAPPMNFARARMTRSSPHCRPPVKGRVSASKQQCTSMLARKTRPSRLLSKWMKFTDYLRDVNTNFSYLPGITALTELRLRTLRITVGVGFVNENDAHRIFPTWAVRVRRQRSRHG
jgi:hypothetical protein